MINYVKVRPVVRSALLVLLLAGLGVFTSTVWRKYSRLKEASTQWASALNTEALELSVHTDQAIRPVDEYFDSVAIPHISNFLSEFSGPWDSGKFAYKYIADKVRFRTYSDRVNEQVKAALYEHLGFPDKMNAAVQASVIRFQNIQQQRDAELREKAYSILDGAGVTVDRAMIDELLRKARVAAEETAFQNIARDSAISFGTAAAGKETAILALQSLIIERAMVAIGTRLGIVTTGATAAAGTAGVGTATGVGAIPGWAIASAEIGVTVVIDLAVGWWLEGKAENAMRDQLNDVRKELHTKLKQYMKECADALGKERASLIEKVM